MSFNERVTEWFKDEAFREPHWSTDDSDRVMVGLIKEMWKDLKAEEKKKHGA